MADQNNRNADETLKEELRETKQELARDEAVIQSEEREIEKLKLSVRGLSAGIFIVLAIVGAIGAYLIVSGRSVYIENSDIEAPEIDLSSDAGGILNDMFVKPGDAVTANEVVARVGDELVKTTIGGIVTKADASIGQSYTAGQTVVAMIDTSALRVVGHIDENKGLDRLTVGQYVSFTVDAFGSKKYYGVVDEVSPQAESGNVIFQISDKREEQVFDVKVRFDTSLYPELKDGMSARIWVRPN